MKTTLLILLTACTTFAQVKTNNNTNPACGPSDVKFSVRTDKNPMPPGQAPAGKALVYFLQDDIGWPHRMLVAKPTYRLGVDGQWVGATHDSSYFYFTVDPGEHSLCANQQFRRGLTLGHQFMAEAGRTYYFRLKDSPWQVREGNGWRFGINSNLHPVDADTGQALLPQLSFSTFEQKK